MPMTSSTELTDYLAGGDAGDAALIAELLPTAETVVTDFCGRDFAGGAFAEAFPAGVRVAVLRNFPVASLTAVTAGDASLDPADFTLDSGRGVVTLRFPAPGTLTVTYATATDAVPPAVTQAVRELVGHWLRQARTATATGQLNLLSVTAAAPEGTVGATTRYPWSQSAGFPLPPAVTQLLGPHRSPRI